MIQERLHWKEKLQPARQSRCKQLTGPEPAASPALTTLPLHTHTPPSFDSKLTPSNVYLSLLL